MKRIFSLATLILFIHGSSYFVSWQADGMEALQTMTMFCRNTTKEESLIQVIKS